MVPMARGRWRSETLALRAAYLEQRPLRIREHPARTPQGRKKCGKSRMAQALAGPGFQSPTFLCIVPEKLAWSTRPDGGVA